MKMPAQHYLRIENLRIEKTEDTVTREVLFSMEYRGKETTHATIGSVVYEIDQLKRARKLGQVNLIGVETLSLMERTLFAIHVEHTGTIDDEAGLVLR